MYTDRGIIYSDAGCYLFDNIKSGYQFPDDGSELREAEVDLTDMYIKGNYIHYGPNFLLKVRSNWTYADYKRDIIKKRYTNDDQIAIMLNREDSDLDAERYDRMMEWRNFASLLASKVMKIIKQ